MDPADVMHFETPTAFRSWLDEHHTSRDELWVGYWKKHTARPSLTWEESVSEALCFGWIDGIRKRLSDEAYAIRFTPRRPRSNWSRKNIDEYRRLEAAGLLRPPGREAFARRSEERSGTYSYDRDEPPSLPEDYLERLKGDEAAWADWQARPPGYRRQTIHWIMSAKREPTRQRRLAALVADCAAGRKIKPLRR